MVYMFCDRRWISSTHNATLHVMNNEAREGMVHVVIVKGSEVRDIARLIGSAHFVLLSQACSSPKP